MTESATRTDTAWHAAGTVVLAVLLVLAGVVDGWAIPSPAQGAAGAPALFSADEVSFDRENGIVSARGNVEVSQESRVVLADVLTFNRRSDILTATGHVSLMEPTGEVIFAEYMELSGDLKQGVIRNLRMILADSARIAANSAVRSRGNITTLHKAVYSPCNLCPEDPTRPPLWQIKAMEVTHNQREQSIEYEDAWLELAGWPVAYTPYLIHPDPTVKRRSGFLVPSMGGSSDLGFVTRVPYYVAIAPDRDATITPIYTKNEGPVLAAEYRQLFGNGELETDGSITHDSNDNVRGHILGKTRFDATDTWRWGANLERTTDDTYMRRYDFGGASTLTSQVYAEGFRRRNYGRIGGYAFQGLEPGDDPGDTPWVLPRGQFSHVGEPDWLGGRNSLDMSVLALTRTDGTDTRRLHVEFGWKKPTIGPLGGIYTLSTNMRGDLYHVDELQRRGKQTYNGLASRIMPVAALEWRHPFVREETSSTYQLLEPMASLVVSPYGGNPDTIPNEDSLDFEFDDTNLFAENRFTGLDRVDGGPRVNFGVKWGIFGAGGGSTTLLVGQSYRFKKDDTFAKGSGLEENLSDFVGRLHVTPGEYVSLEYRTRLDRANLAPRRNEVDVSVGVKALQVRANYAFFDTQTDSQFPGREELTLAVNSQLTRFWRAAFNGITDLRAEEMRSLGLRLTYEDECLVFTTEVGRTFFEDRDVRPTDTIMFRASLKTLGDVQSGFTTSQ